MDGKRKMKKQSTDIQQYTKKHAIPKGGKLHLPLLTVNGNRSNWTEQLNAYELRSPTLQLKIVYICVIFQK